MQTCVVVDCAYGCEKTTQEKALKVEENRRRLADYRDQAAKLAEGLKRLE